MLFRSRKFSNIYAQGRPAHIAGLPCAGGCKYRKTRAFTIIELLVSVGIFALMTALVVAKYSNFNNSILLTNLAYDVAGVVRTAQTYGVSVRNTDTSGSVNNFKSGYGVHFSTDTSINSASNQPNNQTITFFADTNSNFMYNSGTDQSVSTYTLKRGAVILGFCRILSGCSDSSNLDSGGSLDVSFKRPDPDAHICVINDCSDTNYYVEIWIRAPDGSIRSVVVRSNGQIAVKD